MITTIGHKPLSQIQEVRESTKQALITLVAVPIFAAYFIATPVVIKNTLFTHSHSDTSLLLLITCLFISIHGLVIHRFCR